MPIDPKETEFYVISVDDPGTVDELRRCRTIKRVDLGELKDCLLIEIDPPLIGQQFGLGGEDVTMLILSPRLDGESLYPVCVWPTYVNISRPIVDNPKSRDTFSVDEFEFFDIGAIYETEESARRGD